MTPRTARRLAAAFVMLFAVAVTWPAMTWFNRVEPKVFGLPLNMAWIAFWLILDVLVLWMVDVVERRGGRA